MVRDDAVDTDGVAAAHVGGGQLLPLAHPRGVDVVDANEAFKGSAGDFFYFSINWVCEW